MARKPLSSDEIAELRRNPNVASVTDTGKISYTPAFKREAYESLQAGKPMHLFFEEHGLSAAILGDTRIYAFTRNLRTRHRGDDYEDHRAGNKRRPAKARSLEEMTPEEQIEHLRHELAYARQELDFLKKLQALEEQAQKDWEAKQRRKKSSR